MSKTRCNPVRKVRLTTTDQARVSHYPTSLAEHPLQRCWENLDPSFKLSQTIAVGDTLFIVDGNMIQASTDFGKTWFDYSMLPIEFDKFDILPVQCKSEFLILLNLSSRFFEFNDSLDSRAVAEIWLSRDFMKTFELVTDNAEFGPRRHVSCLARSDGSILLNGGTIDDVFQLSDTWISRDGCKTWEKLSDRSEWTLRSVVCNGNTLYAIGLHYDEPARLVLSIKGGETWKECDALKCVPEALINHECLRELICFTSTECMTLQPGSLYWTPVRIPWQEPSMSIRPKQFKAVLNYTARVFAYGVIVVNVATLKGSDTWSSEKW